MTIVSDTSLLQAAILKLEENSKYTKEQAQDALAENKQRQQTLAQRVEKLEAELQEVDALLAIANADGGGDDPEEEVLIPGAKKALGLWAPGEFLNPASPFYAEAMRRSNYINHTTLHPMKAKELEVLANAVRWENERLQAYSSRVQTSNSEGIPSMDLIHNVEGIDWARVAERVSDMSSVKRTAVECRVCWLGNHHPQINHDDWKKAEVDKLNEIVLSFQQDEQTVDWVDVAKKLNTNRTPMDCLQHGFARARLIWNAETDEKLRKSVERFGIDNWQLVARNVSEHATSVQCQNRWNKTLDPSLKRGPWSQEEDDRLRKAVAGYGQSWIQVATTISGRTNDQCRERWLEHVSLSAESLAWTEEDDKTLLETVSSIGKRWKAVSLKVGGSKTGQSCRMRYDKLRKAEDKKCDSASTPANGGSSGSGESSSISMSVAHASLVPSTGELIGESSIVRHETGRDSNGPTLSSKPRPKPRPLARGPAESTAEAPSYVSGLDSATPRQPDNQTVSRLKRGRKRAAAEDSAPRPKRAKTVALGEPDPNTRPEGGDATANIGPAGADPPTDLEQPKRRPKPRPIAQSYKDAKNTDDLGMDITEPSGRSNTLDGGLPISSATEANTTLRRSGRTRQTRSFAEVALPNTQPMEATVEGKAGPTFKKPRGRPRKAQPQPAEPNILQGAQGTDAES